MEEIINGVRAFQRDVFPQYRELFNELAAGQSPAAMLITCSDSRVDPSLLTQAQPGQLFMLRNPGNLVPKYGEHIGGAAAAIEFAVVGLEVPDIILCGHSGCGAMKGLLDPEAVHETPVVGLWLEHAATVRQSLADVGQLDAPDALERAVEANVIVQLDHLRSHPTVAAALDAGRLTLHGWVYDIPTGAVTAYDAERQAFAPL